MSISPHRPMLTTSRSSEKATISYDPLILTPEKVIEVRYVGLELRRS